MVQRCGRMERMDKWSDWLARKCCRMEKSNWARVVCDCILNFVRCRLELKSNVFPFHASFPQYLSSRSPCSNIAWTMRQHHGKIRWWCKCSDDTNFHSPQCLFAHYVFVSSLTRVIIDPLIQIFEIFECLCQIIFYSGYVSHMDS